jgi:hypothetical protein
MSNWLCCLETPGPFAGNLYNMIIKRINASFQGIDIIYPGFDNFLVFHSGQIRAVRSNQFKIDQLLDEVCRLPVRRLFDGP